MYKKVVHIILLTQIVKANDKLLRAWSQQDRFDRKVKYYFSLRIINLFEKLLNE